MDSSEQKLDILIVDDKLENLRLLTRMLKRRGYSTQTADHGRVALSLLAEQTPKLILLDINMPEMDGFTVCQTIKSDPAHSHIPVIFLSAFTEPEDKVRGFDVGAVDYVTKPFHYHEVVARVETHIALSQQREEIRILREKEADYFSDITQVKDRIMHKATHDLRNPLASIQLSVTLLRNMLQDPNERVDKYLSKIEFDVDRMFSMLMDLLDITTVDSVEDMAGSDVEIDGFWNLVLSDVSERVTDHGNTIQVNAIEDPTHTWLRPNPVVLILRNLIMLMLHFAKPGDPLTCLTKAKDEMIHFIVQLEPQSDFDGFTGNPKLARHLELSLDMLNLVASQFDGMIEQHSSDEDGHRFVLKLPIKPIAE